MDRDWVSGKSGGCEERWFWKLRTATVACGIKAPTICTDCQLVPRDVAVCSVMVACALETRFRGLETALSMAEAVASVALGRHYAFSWRVHKNQQPSACFPFVNWPHFFVKLTSNGSGFL